MPNSKILLHLQHRGLAITQEAIIARYTDIGFGDVLSDGADVASHRKICGHLLHSKKPPKSLSSSRMLTQGRAAQGSQQFATTYYRIFYIRFETNLALVIIKAGMEALSLYLEASLEIGKAVMVLDPCCVTYWNGIPVITSPHPFMPLPENTFPTIDVLPAGHLTGGEMKSFCIQVDQIIVTDVDFQEGCSHDFCDSRYGIDCPGSCSGGKLMVPEVKFHVPGIRAGWVPYKSRSLALSVFEAKALVIPTSAATDFLEMADFLEKTLKEHHLFRITGWFKPAVREGDIVTDNFKLHVSALDILGTTLPSFVRPTQDIHSGSENIVRSSSPANE